MEQPKIMNAYATYGEAAYKLVENIVKIKRMTYVSEGLNAKVDLANRVQHHILWNTITDPMPEEDLRWLFKLLQELLITFLYTESRQTMNEIKDWACHLQYTIEKLENGRA